MLQHPGAHIGQNRAQPLGAVRNQLGCQHRHLRAGHHGLERILRAMHAAGQRQVGRDAPVQDRDPAQRQPQIVRAAERQAGHHLQRLQIEVGLIEAVEQHQPVGAGLGESLGQMRQRGDEGAQLERDRDTHPRANRADEVDIRIFKLSPTYACVGRQVVDVQLQCIGAGLLDFMRILDPSAGRDAVEAADHRNIKRLLQPPQVIEIALGANIVALHLGKIAERLGIGLGAAAEVMIELVTLVGDLLLEQRVQHDRRCTGGLQSARQLDLFR